MTTEQQSLAALVLPQKWSTSARYATAGPYIGIRREVCERYPMAGWGMTWRGYGSDRDLGTHPTLEAAQAAAWEHHLATQASALDLGKMVALVEVARRVQRVYWEETDDNLIGAMYAVDAALADLIKE